MNRSGGIHTYMFRVDCWQAIKEDVTLQIGQGSARDAVSSYFFRLICVTQTKQNHNQFLTIASQNHSVNFPVFCHGSVFPL